VRSTREESVLFGFLYFANELNVVAPTVAAQLEFQELVRDAIITGVPVTSSRIQSLGVEPVNSSSFRYSFTVLPPLTQVDLTADSISSRLTSGTAPVDVVFNGQSLSGTAVIEVVGNAATTASPTIAPTFTPSYLPTDAPSAQPTRAPTPVDTSLSGATDSEQSSAGSGWTMKDTTTLLVALLVTVIVMLVIFQTIYIRRKRENILVAFNKQMGIAPVSGSGWWASEAAGDNPQHYYPPVTEAWAN
jgi:hypothetical protein